MVVATEPPQRAPLRLVSALAMRKEAAFRRRDPLTGLPAQP